MFKYLLCILFCSCATAPEQPTKPTTKKKVKRVLPTWVQDTCKKTKNGYLMVGYGEGNSLATATRQALISSRGDALLCVFGGTYSATTTVQDTNTTSSIQARTQVSFKYKSVNWSGFTKTATPMFFTRNGKNGVYVQYFWTIAAIDEERRRIDALNRQIEKNRAIKEQIKVKDKLIEEQKETLQAIELQEKELRGLEEKTKKALLTLNKLQSKKKHRDKNLKLVIDRLECGTSIHDLMDVIGDPDEYIEDTCEIKASYGKFVVHTHNCKTDSLETAAITRVYSNHGNKNYKIVCGR